LTGGDRIFWKPTFSGRKSAILQKAVKPRQCVGIADNELGNAKGAYAYLVLAIRNFAGFHCED
jgi:hypothetical protein